MLQILHDQEQSRNSAHVPVKLCLASNSVSWWDSWCLFTLCLLLGALWYTHQCATGELKAVSLRETKAKVMCCEAIKKAPLASC